MDDSLPRQMGRQQIKYCIAHIRIAARGNEASRLVQHDVETGLTMDEFTPDFDMVLFRGLRAEVGADAAVYRDATVGNQLVAVASRPDTGCREKTV